MLIETLILYYVTNHNGVVKHNIYIKLGCFPKINTDTFHIYRIKNVIYSTQSFTVDILKRLEFSREYFYKQILNIIFQTLKLKVFMQIISFTYD